MIRPKLGICQWFHYLDYATVERSVELMRDLGVRHLRTGISWAEYHQPLGRQWYDWQMSQLAELDVLLSISHTPPSISEGDACNSPPRNLRAYAEFVADVFCQYGGAYNSLELWNEPNHLLHWNFRDFDPQWHKFSRMVAMAASQAHHDGTRTVLGGMAPVDGEWLQCLDTARALEHVDVIAFHGFPEDGHLDWKGWRHKTEILAPHCRGRPLWVTETGLATWDATQRRASREELQVKMLEIAAAAPVERLYWSSLIDLDPRRDAPDGFHVDESHYHMGLVTWEGSCKDAFFCMKELLAESEPDEGATPVIRAGEGTVAPPPALVATT